MIILIETAKKNIDIGSPQLRKQLGLEFLYSAVIKHNIT